MPDRVSQRVLRHRLSVGALTLLLCTAAAAIGAAAIWTWRPGWVDAAQAFWVERHERAARESLARAERLLPHDRVAAVVALRDLQSALQPVRRFHRLDPYKRRGLELLVETLHDRPADQLPWLDRWIEFEPFDLRPKVLRARTLLGLPGRGYEGRAALQALFERFPESGRVAPPWIALLLAEGAGAEAGRALVAHLRAGGAPLPLGDRRDQQWTIAYDKGDGLDLAGMRPARAAVDERAFALSFPILPGTHSVRLQPPAGLALTLRRPRLQVEVPGQGIDLPLDATTLPTVGIAWEDAALVFDAAGFAAMFLQLPVQAPVAVPCALRADCELPDLAWLRALFAAPEAVDAAFAACAGADPVQRWAAHRVHDLQSRVAGLEGPR